MEADPTYAQDNGTGPLERYLPLPLPGTSCLPRRSTYQNATGQCPPPTESASFWDRRHREPVGSGIMRRGPPTTRLLSHSQWTIRTGRRGRARITLWRYSAGTRETTTNFAYEGQWKCRLRNSELKITFFCLFGISKRHKKL